VKQGWIFNEGPKIFDPTDKVDVIYHNDLAILRQPVQDVNWEQVEYYRLSSNKEDDFRVP